jgi:DNA replication initiation complex subunit (GINS family)
LVNYLRVRLHKIESQAHYIINSQTELEKLSEAEQRYLNKLLDLNNDHIDQTITSRLGNEAKSLYNANDDFAEHGRPVMSVRADEWNKSFSCVLQSSLSLSLSLSLYPS